MKISKRLKMSAELVPKGLLLADIGTDHGYLPIYVIEEGKVKRAVASDISRGSADKAYENVLSHGLEEKIDVRCGKGLETLKENEFPDIIVLTGMGGVLMTEILEEGRAKTQRAACLILQPQHNIDRVRAYVRGAGFKITDEAMTAEQGKYYFSLKCEKGEDVPYNETDLEVGRFLPESGNPLFKEFLREKIYKYSESIKRAYEKNSETDISKLERKLEILKEADKIGELSKM
ncbi:MAG: class I SAM-dependent methyltransferase [Clostridiales bacterium]|nr:class I SAM-dependent methyltransferase [Clostridiales bacterium]